MDLVSVIIPFYKKKEFIKEAIRSILKQTYSKIEIIIIYDDNNHEDLRYLTKNFGKNKNVKILVNKNNIGAGQSRNKGIKASKGKYVCFLDADDYWKKEKILKQITFMKKFNFKISHTSYFIVDQVKKLQSIRKAKNINNYKDIIKSCDVGLSTVILERSIITNKLNFSSLKTKEDFVLWLKILKSGLKIGAVKESLSYWRKTKNSLSSSIVQKLLDGFRVYRNYMKYSRFKSFYLLLCLSLNYIKK